MIIKYLYSISCLCIFVISYALEVPKAFAETEKPKLNPHTKRFLEHTEAQKFWWYMGTFTTLSHLVSQTNEKQAECIDRWYFDDHENKRRIIERTLSKYPDYVPSSVILGLLYKDCGKFKVQ